MLPAIQTFVTAHWELITFFSLYAFVAFVNALPDPDDPRPFGKKLYFTLYTFLHILSNKAIEKRPALAQPPVQIGGTSQTINVQPPKETK